MNNEYISCLQSTATAESMEFDQAASTNSLPDMPPHSQDVFQHPRLHPDITINQEPILNITDNRTEAAIVDHQRTSQGQLESQVEIYETQFISSSSEKLVHFALRPNASNVVMLQNEGQKLPDDGASSNDDAFSLAEFLYSSEEATPHPQHPEISTTQELETKLYRNVFEMAVDEQPGTLNMQFESNVDIEIDETPQFVSLCSEQMDKCRVLNRNNDEEDAMQLAPRPLSPEVVLLPINDQELSDDECMKEYTPKPCLESLFKPNVLNENLNTKRDEDVAPDSVPFQVSFQKDQQLKELEKDQVLVVGGQVVTERLSVSSNHDIAEVILEAACSFRSPLQKWIQPFPPPDVNGSFARLSPPEQATAFQRIILTALHSLYCSDLICPIDKCTIMKNTVLHGPCELEGNSCPVWYCSTVTWIWDHYIDCSEENCRYCYPINLVEDVITEARNPLNQIAIRIILHRLALGRPPICNALRSIPMYTNNWHNKLCRWHCRCVRRYSMRKGEHYDYHLIRTTASQKRNQTLYNHCSRRNYSMLSSCTTKNFLLAKYKLIKLERSLLILTYMLIPCVKGVCESLCKCRPFPSVKMF